MSPPAATWDQAYRQQEDQRRREQEDASRRRQEESRRRDEQKKRDEEMKKKREEEQKRKDEDMKRKKEVEEKRRVEQKATLAIRRVIQKVRLANPETFDELNKELQEVTTAEMANTGSQLAKIKEEAEKSLEQAKKRVEQITEQRKKEQEKKDAEDKKRKEAETRCKELVKALEDLVNAAEAGAAKLKAVAEPLDRESDDLSIADVEAVAKRVEEAGIGAKAATKACTDFIMTNGSEMKDPTPTMVNQPASEMKQSIAKLLQRINDCTKVTESSIQTARGAKDKAVRRASARERTKEMEAIFERYDKDTDDLLSRKEILAYSQGEFKFAVPEETIKNIWKNIVAPGDKGVKMDQFHLLKVSVGVARELERDLKRRKLRQEKEEVLKGKKADLQEKVKKASVSVDQADKEVHKVESKVQPLLAMVSATPVPEMLKISDEAEAMMKVARKVMEMAHDHISTVSEGITEPFKADLLTFLVQEAKTVELKLRRMDTRLDRCKNLARRFREQGLRKRAIELETCRSAASEVIRYNQRRRKQDAEELFKSFGPKDGKVGEKAFMAFFEAADKDIKELTEDGEIVEPKPEEAPVAAEGEEKPAEVKPAEAKPAVALKVELTKDVLTRLFNGLSEPEGKVRVISKEMIMRMVRVCYKVVKETTMTDDLSISDGKPIRALAVNEVVEVISGPVKEGTVEVRRIQAKAMKDGKEGWITMAGNAGTVYLQEGGKYYKVVKETYLTNAMEPSEEVPEGSRKLREGEVLEVFEWPQKHEESGHFRMKAQVRVDGSVGWLTSSKDGVVFAEIL